MTATLDTLFDSLRTQALALPEAWEDHPWGETAIKVRAKVFVFLGRGEGGLSMTVKLPRSAPFAAELPGCAPAGYGLGRSGWITARLSDATTPDADHLAAWVRESYRAVAPRALAARVTA